jgi:hypothetical protein
LTTLSVAVILCWYPHQSAAQNQLAGTIAGVVRDTSGLPLPGVSVEASSPALIERVRVAVTDDQGLYRIVDLRPGVYTVSFTVSGFSSLRRDGLELTAGFLMTVNAELAVGAIEETITVSGQTPIVDTRNTAQNETFTETAIDELPTAKTYNNLGVLIPGVSVAGFTGTLNTQDVGGSSGERNATLTFHGSRPGDMRTLLDGIRVHNALGSGGGGSNGWVANAGMVEEMAFGTSGFAADTESSGVLINIIPRQGGNRFSGSFAAAYTNDELQTDNLDDSLKAWGLSRYLTTKIYDFNPAFGGPIKRDRLWFYYSFRKWGSTDRPPGAYYDLNPDDWVFTPDLTHPAENAVYVTANNLRLTLQANRSNKFVLYYDHLYGGTDGTQVSPSLSVEAARNRFWPVNDLWYGTWTWTVSNRLLVEAGQAYRAEDVFYGQDLNAALDNIQVTDTGRGVTFRAHGNDNRWIMKMFPGKATVSYVTGSHMLKAGTQWVFGRRRTTNYFWGKTEDMHYYDVSATSGRLHEYTDVTYTFNNGVPTAVNYFIPNTAIDRVRLNLGLFVQDQVTIGRLTANLGVRLDYLNGDVPAQHVPASRFSPARDYPAYENLPNWKDLAPRLGLAYDISGTGRTILKWNLGRYVEAMATGIAGAVNPPLATSNTRTTRSWTDNGDFIPQENELGASSNTNFGTAQVGTRYADDTVTGWDTREKNWETSISVEHELRQGLALNAGYYRRTRGNFRVTDNLLWEPSEFDEFCVTAPVDARLPDGGGNLICGLYNITPTKFGRNDNIVTLDTRFGEQTEVYDGVDVVASARLPGGISFQGGTSTGRIATNRCFIIDSPQELRFCDVRPPFQTQIKLSGIYPLPWWGIKASAAYQSLPGPQITATWSAPAAAVTGLGRPLSGNARTVSVPLVAPGTMFGERLHQVDVRGIKEFSVHAQTRIQLQFDVYNLLNSNAVIALNNTYGANWQQPLAVLAGRLFKFGVLLKF